ncbi:MULTISPECIES: hypothetical protein [unclassified Bradyrhizobium]|uniref:hypothetical protein n=1 Tax=unclassified Bradyrhizobium TaxID=2631580 RepID=UPI0028EF8FD2|nr:MULTISPECIES: hypothetical protein [unclassified Bradyrhizobium]
MLDPGRGMERHLRAAEVCLIVSGAAGLSVVLRFNGPVCMEQYPIMTESIPPHPFDDMEALAWLRSQPELHLTVSAAELGRQWGWNRMRTSRRLKAWERAGLIRRNAEAIIVTGASTSTVTAPVTDRRAVITETADITEMSGAHGAYRPTTAIKLAAVIVALALACVSAAFSINGLTAIFAGAFWPVIIMGAVLEAGKLVAVAWLTEHWSSAPPLLRLAFVLMIGVLMGLNAIGVFGFLTRAHLEHRASIDFALANRIADVEARLGIQSRVVADIDRRVAQIDAAIEEATRIGRPVGAMTLADQKRRERADIVAERRRESQALANLQIEQANIDAQRRRAEAEVGPVRYLAELLGIPATDFERAVKLLTLALVAVLDPMAVALLLAAGVHARRGGGILAHAECHNLFPEGEATGTECAPGGTNEGLSRSSPTQIEGAKRLCIARAYVSRSRTKTQQVADAATDFSGELYASAIWRGAQRRGGMEK